MENVAGVKKKGKRKGSRYGKRYGLEFKLRCVKLRFEEGLPISLLSKEVGASKDVIRRWVKAYQERGEAGLRNRVVSTGSRRKLPCPFHVTWCSPYLFLFNPGVGMTEGYPSVRAGSDQITPSLIHPSLCHKGIAWINHSG
jgi:hypothetical protein